MASDYVGGRGGADDSPCGDSEYPAASGSHRGPSSTLHKPGRPPIFAQSPSPDSPDYSALFQEYLEDPTSDLNNSYGSNGVQEGYTSITQEGLTATAQHSESGYHTGTIASVPLALETAPKGLSSNLHLSLPSSNLGSNFQQPSASSPSPTTRQGDIGTMTTSQVIAVHCHRSNVLKRPAADDCNGEDQVLLLDDVHRHARYTVSQQMSLGPEQQAAINSLRTVCETYNRLPSEEELQDVAGQVGLSFIEVTMLVGEKISLRRELPAPASPSLFHVSSAPDRGNEQVTREIEAYIWERMNRGCAPMSRKERRDKTAAKYHCTLGCAYASDKKGDWIRHEEETHPQEFWHCIVCRRMRAINGITKPFIHHRADKIKNHIDTQHADDDRASLREASKVLYERPTFDQQCTFVSQENARCTYWSETWRQRNDHYTRYFSGTGLGGPWYGPGGGGGGGGGHGGDGDGRPGPNSKPFRSHSKPRGTRNRGKNGSQSNAAGGAFGGPAYQFALSCAMSHNSSVPKALLYSSSSQVTKAHKPDFVRSRRLLDIESWSYVQMPLDTRFLALHCSSIRSKLTARENPETSWCKTLERSARLTAELGFNFLWVDEPCATDTPCKSSFTTFSQAVMIIIMLETENLADKIWHFTCRYSEFTEVLGWARTKASFQSHHLLGHGAHGVVDKVELKLASLTRGFLARKVVLNADSSAKKDKGVSPFHEVTLMQKFNHPHIARFVAAYSDSNSFNILMEPIADCDLRQFLKDPEQRSRDGVDMRKWFLSLASAVAHIHALNCRHKDIKPANILISRGNVFLSDFGTSGHYPEDDTKTSGGAYMTPKYCAPEVASQGERGRKADIFSLGCVYAEMIAVARGDTMGTFYNSIGFTKQSDVKEATYHARRKAVVKHIATSAVRATNRYLLTETLLCVEMLDDDPSERPSALDVIARLLDGREYNVDTEVYGCPCCSFPSQPQREQTQRAIDATSRSRSYWSRRRGRGSPFGPKSYRLGIQDGNQQTYDAVRSKVIGTGMPQASPWRGFGGRSIDELQLSGRRNVQSSLDNPAVAHGHQSFLGIRLHEQDADGTQKINRLLTRINFDDPSHP